MPFSISQVRSGRPPSRPSFVALSETADSEVGRYESKLQPPIENDTRLEGRADEASGTFAAAFTIMELLMVIVLLGIVFGLTLPMIGDAKELRLREAARMLAGDLELAANESISHGGEPRLVKFDLANNRYWIAAASAPDTPITDPVTKQPFLVSFGTGRASGTAGVTIQSINVGGDDRIRFNAYGSPDQSTDATVTLACGPATMTVRVKAGSGEVVIP